MSEPAQNRVGREFAGRFEILRVVGEGGMGAVYEARQKFTGRHVALKMIHAGIASAPVARERFFREAKAPNAIGHPAIVEVFDAGIADDGTLYLAMELLHGEDLGHALRGRRITAEEAIRIGADVLDVLAAAHERGLVHRDIKPENVFLAREGAGYRVRVLDFGVIRHLGDLDSKLTSPGTVLGTPYYMSPEQARGEPVDGRADLWSVGAMLHHALAGRPPFPGENYNKVMVGILAEPAPRCADGRPDLPGPLCAAIDRALEKDRDRRWLSAREMAAALTGAARSLPPGALPEFMLAPTIVSDAVPRSGAGSAKPSDGEWGPGESHSTGRGGAAPSEGRVPRSGVVRSTVVERKAPRPWPFVAAAGALLVIGALALTLVAGLYVGRRSAERRPTRNVEIGMNVIIDGEPFSPSISVQRCLRGCSREYDRCRSDTTDPASLGACGEELARCNDRCLDAR